MSGGQANRRKQRALAPHTGGKPIPEAVQNAVRMRVLNHARDKYAGKYRKIDVRFDDDLCFIDAFRNPEPGSEVVAALTHETREQYVERIRNTPVHLVRLGYFDEDRRSLSFYTYSHERYEPCSYPNGEEFGTVEQAFDVGAVYLTD
jgi:hypothetical protein